jgi:hypothetical protein
MFENGLQPDAVEACGGEGQAMRVGEQARVLRCIDIGADDLDIGIAIKAARAPTDLAAADDQHGWPRRLTLHMVEEVAALLGRHLIAPVDKEMKTRAK